MFIKNSHLAPVTTKYPVNNDIKSVKSTKTLKKGGDLVS